MTLPILRKFGTITEWSEELGNKFFDYYGKVFEDQER